MTGETSHRKRGRPPHPDILTPREWQVLDLIRQGLTNERIAERLDISFATAKYHVAEIISKLGVQSREEAAAWQQADEPDGWFRLVLWMKIAAAGGALMVLVAVAATLVFAWPTRDEADSSSALSARSPGSPPSSPAALPTRTPRPATFPATIAVEAYEPSDTPPRCGDLSSTPLSPGVYLLNTTDCLTQQLTSGSDSARGWTPDGQKLVFVRYEGDQFTAANSDIYLLDIATNTTSNLSNSPLVRDEKPLLSPDGKTVAYSSLSLDQLGSSPLVENHPDWVHDLIVRPADSTNDPVKILSVRGQFEMGWSPDGSSLAVMTHSGDVMVVPPNGNHVTLASDASGLWTPEWSPRGDWIAYSCKVLPESTYYKDVCLVSPDGKQKMIPSVLIYGPAPFIPTAEGAAAPFWNSDGSLLFQMGHSGLVTVDVDIMSVDQVLAGGGAIYEFDAEAHSLLTRCVDTTPPCGIHDVLILNVESGDIDPVVRVGCGQAIEVMTAELNLVISMTGEPPCGL